VRFAIDSLTRRPQAFIVHVVFACAGLGVVVGTAVEWVGDTDLGRAAALVRLLVGGAVSLGAVWRLRAAHREWRDPWSRRQVLSKQRRRGIGRSMYLVWLSPVTTRPVRLPRQEWDSLHTDDYTS
jgi:hypothetical protein